MINAVLRFGFKCKLEPWLEESFHHNEEKSGVKLRTGGWYITLAIYERYPACSSTTFQSCEAEWTVDAEGLIARQVIVRKVTGGRRTRSTAPADTVCISEEQLQMMETLCTVRLNP
jgi:hypothetical protein